MGADELEGRLENIARTPGPSGKEVPSAVAALVAGFLKGVGGQPLKASELDATADELLRAWTTSLGEGQ
jgi:hypothetical protein